MYTYELVKAGVVYVCISVYLIIVNGTCQR